jgi:hypothetical protein
MEITVWALRGMEQYVQGSANHLGTDVDVLYVLKLL